MDSQPQLTHSHGQQHPEDPLHRPGEEEQPEKISMFKKVRAKARKIKDSLTHKTHGSNSSNDQEEDVTDEEQDIVQDPEIHGAPMYESAAAKDYAAAPDVNIARPADPVPTKHSDPMPTKHSDPMPTLGENVCPGTFQTKVTDSSFPDAPKHDSRAPGNFTAEPEPKFGALKGTMGEKLRENTDVPKPRHDGIAPQPGYVSEAIKNFDTPHDVNTRNEKDTFGEPILEEPKSPKRKHDDFLDSAKFQSNAGVGSQGAGVSPTKRGSDDLFGSQGAGVSPTKTGSDDLFGSQGAGVSPTKTGSDDQYGSQGAGVTPTTTGSNDVIGHKGAGATSILSSFDKMAIYDEPGHKKESTTTGSHDQFAPTPSPSPTQTPIPGFSSHKTDPLQENTPSVPESYNASTTTDEHHPQDMNVDQPATQQTGYMGKIAAVGTGLAGTVASKIGYGGNNENAPSSGFPRPDEVEQNRNVSGEPQKDQSSYISSATSAAVTAKNAVASKLGYGGSETAGPPTPVTTPVAEMARSGGPETAQSGTPMETDRGVVGETDKGVGMTGYIAEKLKPGEDDKALSDVISGALHKKPSAKGVDEEEKSNIGGMVKDAIHKTDDTDRESTKPMGKVTESDEVAARLGSSESEKTGHAPNTGNESPSSTGVVAQFKGAFTNWFGKGGETNPSMAFNDQTASHDTTGDALKGEKMSGEGERRPHESSN
ncbi:hypothetical protein ACHQM5_000710 [Ranunculus cassubicifolius]